LILLLSFFENFHMPIVSHLARSRPEQVQQRP
jgi:hypothetical protein